MDWIQFVLFLLQLAPQILALIKQIEEAFPNVQGSAKKSLVLDLVNASISADSKATELTKSRDLTGAVGKMVDTQVSALNATGIFKKAH